MQNNPFYEKEPAPEVLSTGTTHRWDGGMPKQVKKMIVEALIFPHLKFCFSVWAGCGKMQRHRVQKVKPLCTGRIRLAKIFACNSAAEEAEGTR